jgi:flagellar hook-basal body complex protein FliE
MAINEIGSIGSLAPSRSLFETIDEQNGAESSIPFSDYLKQAINDTNNILIEADNLADQFALGKTDNIPQVLIAAQKADVAFQFTMQIRNSILDAYKEIMQMQI